MELNIVTSIFQSLQKFKFLDEGFDGSKIEEILLSSQILLEPKRFSRKMSISGDFCYRLNLKDIPEESRLKNEKNQNGILNLKTK